jgi:hypothetical protein
LSGLCDTRTMKGQQKPKKVGKKPAQKTLKERRSEKRAAAKQNRSLDV